MDGTLQYTGRCAGAFGLAMLIAPTGLSLSASAATGLSAGLIFAALAPLESRWKTAHWVFMAGRWVLGAALGACAGGIAAWLFSAQPHGIWAGALAGIWMAKQSVESECASESEKPRTAKPVGQFLRAGRSRGVPASAVVS